MTLRLTDREGFTPQIARLVGMMDYVRQTTLDAVQGMSSQELDFIPPEQGNSAGMLLEHFAAVEVYYQALTFGTHDDPMQAVGDRWLPGMALGTLGRETIRGQPLRHYLTQLAEIRADTLRQLRERDDAWLDEPLPLWGQTSNRHFMWFHVFEDELNHRGQIRLIHKYLPRLKHPGLLGAGFGPATPDGLGLRCLGVWPGTPAAAAGLHIGDVVLNYDGQDVTRTPSIEIALTQSAGVSSTFEVQRGEERLTLEVGRAARPG